MDDKMTGIRIFVDHVGRLKGFWPIRVLGGEEEVYTLFPLSNSVIQKRKSAGFSEMTKKRIFLHDLIIQTIIF
jgi:hypothetical protein